MSIPWNLQFEHFEWLAVMRANSCWRFFENARAAKKNRPEQAQFFWTERGAYGVRKIIEFRPAKHFAILF